MQVGYEKIVIIDQCLALLGNDTSRDSYFGSVIGTRM